VTVAELREALAKFPDEMRVVVRGFDGFGYEDLKPPEEISVRIGVYSGGHDSSHKEVKKQFEPGSTRVVSIDM
jgi:hypothetical protein